MATPATPLPPVVFEDGLGQRRRVVGARNQTLSVLFLDAELTADPGFEPALRERLAQVGGFHHEAFARARGVVHVTRTPLRLALASDFVEGLRLSDMLTVADERLLPIEIDAAFGVIRQLAAAIAALHEQGGTSHGALAPERIIVTADARVVVAEYVLGAALERLRFTPQRYWQDLRIALPAGPDAPLDRRADVTQLGAIALALIVGRPLREDEYPAGVPEMVEGVRAISATGLEQLPAGVRTWLRRALQLDPHGSFASASEAFAALDGIREVNERSARQALRAFVGTCQEALEPQDTARETGTGDRGSGTGDRRLRPAADPESRVPSPDSLVSGSESRVPASQPVQREAMPEHRHLPEERSSELRIVPRPETTGRMFTSVDEPEAATKTVAADTGDATHDADRTGPPDMQDGAEDTLPEPRASVVQRIWRRHRLASAAAVVVLLASAGTVAARSYLATDPVGTLIVNTSPTGVTVVVDGQHRGSTPLSLELAPGNHVLQIVSDGFVRKIPVTIAEGREVAQFIELPAVAPAPADGHLHVRSEPAGARVLIDGEYRGVAPLTIEGIAPGAHAVKVEDGSASVTQQVTIEAGVTASLVVPMAVARDVPVSGWIAVVAPAEVQIYENRRLLGSSRSEQIMVAAGRHDLEIVNEGLGYRVTRTVQVTAGNTATIRLEWPQGSLALNAQPWAEVWVDGERLGETPIGNVQVPIGDHRVVFRHPELGEQAHTATVTMNGPARISADMRR